MIVIRDQKVQHSVPWVPEFFLACGGNFRCWPKADTSSNLTETGNRARKVSGTQGKHSASMVDF